VGEETVSASTVPVGSPLAALEKLQRPSLLVGGVALIACLLLGLVSPAMWEQMFRSYLVAFVLFNGISVGALAVIMIGYLTGGTWAFVIRRPLEAATRVLPFCVLLFLPVLLGIPSLYEWARPEAKYDAMLKAKEPFLNVPFFLVRVVIYFAIWNGLALLLNRWSRRADETKDPKIVEWCESLSGPGMLLFAITTTFAAIDWMMSLEPRWYSTIYGPMVGWGFILSAYAVTLITTLVLREEPAISTAIPRDRLGELATLLLAFVMIWGYLSLMQWILIWSTNLPEEAPWYVRRLESGWTYVGVSLMVVHFAVPFSSLMVHSWRRNVKLVLAVACLVLFMRLVDTSWLILPATPKEHSPPVTDAAMLGFTLLAVIGVGGIWLGVYLWQIRMLPLVPLYRPVETPNHDH
jgi:hypothetical protein